jgi:hypothetical protein
MKITFDPQSYAEFYGLNVCDVEARWHKEILPKLEKELENLFG